MTRVKICGITNVEDALAAVQAGADALGFVFAPSPRWIAQETAVEIISRLPPFVAKVGVFDDLDSPLARATALTLTLELDAIQLHGVEAPSVFLPTLLPIIKRFPVFDEDTHDTLRARTEGHEIAAFLVDPGAGSGKTFRWEIASGLPQPLIISGGLTAQNVAMAIRLARPYAVDVSSGVESSSGKKDHAKMRAFVQAVRDADANTNNA